MIEHPEMVERPCYPSTMPTAPGAESLYLVDGAVLWVRREARDWTAAERMADGWAVLMHMPRLHFVKPSGLWIDLPSDDSRRDIAKALAATE